ncbi:MAG: hypothetical protein Ct9H300mP12_15130 [Acidimicrobiales bacterium]|nr:MAG: hypothetical protein Ct9H300mP12_15130 [Acidimicrobiales bacterium]
MWSSMWATLRTVWAWGTLMIRSLVPIMSTTVAGGPSSDSSSRAIRRPWFPSDAPVPGTEVREAGLPVPIEGDAVAEEHGFTGQDRIRSVDRSDSRS